MSFVRPALLALATLVAPAAVHAEDNDELCVGWVHVFVDATHDDGKFTTRSTSTCLQVATSIDEHTPGEEGKPYRGEYPEWDTEQECKALEGAIDEMSRAVRQATEFLPAAQQALDKARGGSVDEADAYKSARLMWQAAVDALAAAKKAYEDVYDLEVETERDAEGRVVVAHRIGYRSDTELGRAVLDAMKREQEAREAMEKVWASWSRPLQDAQYRVDHYTSILALYPGQIEAARALAAELGCP